MNLMEEKLKEGGAPVFTKYSVTVGDALWTNLYSNIDNDKYAIDGVFEDGGQKFAVLQNREDNSFSRMNFSFDNDEFTCEEIEAISEYSQSEEPQFNAADVEAFVSEFKKKKDEEKKDEEKEDDSEDEKKKNPFEKKDDKSNDEEDSKDSEDDSEDEKKKKKKKFNLDEIEEYVSLKTQFDELTTNFAALQETNKDLLAKVEELTNFKNSVDRTAKEDLINNQFFMLDAEDKKDVIENIDTYSLDDIEAKLAVIAVRKKVNFSLDEQEQKEGQTTFNLDNVDNDDMVPAWIKAVKATAKSMNE